MFDDGPEAVNQHTIYSCVSSETFQESSMPCKSAIFQWVRIPPGQSVAQPEATRAAKDQTVCLNRSSTRETVIKSPS
jgi:hypothetical protein